MSLQENLREFDKFYTSGSAAKTCDNCPPAGAGLISGGHLGTRRAAKLGSGAAAEKTGGGNDGEPSHGGPAAGRPLVSRDDTAALFQNQEQPAQTRLADPPYVRTRAISDVNTAAAAAAAAISSGDWATAETQTMVAMAYLAAIPNSELGGLSKLEYSRTDLAELLKQIRLNRNAAAIGAAGGVRRQKTKYKRAGLTDDC